MLTIGNYPIEQVSEILKALLANPTIVVRSSIPGLQRVGIVVLHEFRPAELAVIMLPSLTKASVLFP